MLAKDFGKKLKEMRKKQGLTQIQLADLCGIEQHEISIIEGGRRNLTLRNVQRICASMGIKVEISLSESLDKT